MANVFVLTVVDQANNTQRAEVQLIDRACMLAAQQVRAQKVVTSGNVIADKGQVIASWVYTPSAGSTG
jgi:hypothetical protein